MNTPFKQNQKPNNPKVANFLESLRQRSNTPSSLEPSFSPFESYQEKKRLEQQRKEEFFRSRTKEFNEIYSQTKQAEVAKIEEITVKLRETAASMKQLEKQVDVAVHQKPSVKTTGKYHFSFLDHLKQTLELLRRQIESTNTWLQVFNSRQRQKGFYWNQTAKGGSQFMLSMERQLATSIG